MPALKRTRDPVTLRPNKRLGQHFLRDRSFISGIIERSGFLKTNNVLEIGPGLGALTIPLAERVRFVTAVEKDARLAETLNKRLNQEGITNVALFNDDILRVDLGKILGPVEERIQAIGNLPYNISSPFLDVLFRYRHLIRSAVLMFQYEFAERLLASPGGKDYGALTVLMRYNAETTPLLHVPGEAFYPRPKVGSMVVRIDLERPYGRRAEDEGIFTMVVKGSFAHRRKTILNSLGGALTSWENKEIREALTLCSIDPIRRAETLSIDEFINLADTMKRRESVRGKGQGGRW
jgi:16S rRNA (adenine1518-N6/adenine1519-N6)-dimethyltransferase